MRAFPAWGGGQHAPAAACVAERVGEPFVAVGAAHRAAPAASGCSGSGSDWSGSPLSLPRLDARRAGRARGLPLPRGRRAARRTGAGARWLSASIVASIRRRRLCSRFACSASAASRASLVGLVVGVQFGLGHTWLAPRSAQADAEHESAGGPRISAQDRALGPSSSSWMPGATLSAYDTAGVLIEESASEYPKRYARPPDGTVLRREPSRAGRPPKVLIRRRTTDVGKAYPADRPSTQSGAPVDDAPPLLGRAGGSGVGGLGPAARILG